MKKRIITGFIKKEFKQIIRDKKMILVLCFLPTVQTILFGLALTNEVKNIKLVTMAKPNDAIAQKIKEKTLASGWFKKVKNVDTADFSKAENLLLSRKAEAILIAPKEGFLHGIERNKPIQLLIDATNAARARQTDAYIKTIISQVVQERNTKSNISSLIEIDIRVLYNHNLNTAPFMIPAISVLSTFMVIMLVCCMAVTKEKEQGTMEKLISSPATLVEIIVGKTLPYIFIGVFLVCFIIFVGVVTMDVPLRGCLWQIFVTAIFFILTALSLAIIVSTMANNQQQAMMG
ncbi:MAG: ABC transporter permease, partial [Endomicrobium sp.]|nr:ABC transporter permease [Endomicrobium sp.]